MNKGKYVAYVSSYTQGDSHGIRIYDVDMKNGRFKEKDKVENVINYHMRDSRKSWEYLTKLDEENSKYFKRNEEK